MSTTFLSIPTRCLDNPGRQAFLGHWPVSRQDWDLERRAASHARLLAEARRTGRLLHGAQLAAALNAAPVKDAAGEHGVFLNEGDGRYYKLTKPGAYGMQVDDTEAYVERWALANHPLGFGDRVRFEGLVQLPGQDDYRAVISQPAYLGRDAKSWNRFKLSGNVATEALESPAPWRADTAVRKRGDWSGFRDQPPLQTPPPMGKEPH